MTRKDIIVKALWEWLHGKHPSEDGEYEVRNAFLWNVLDETCVGVDSEIDLTALAEFIDKAL